MELNTPYPPLIRASLKMRGVFGLSWQLYKRGFWPMFGFALLLVGLFLLILMLVMFSALEKSGAMMDMESGIRQFGTTAGSAAGGEAVASMFGFMAVMWLISLAYAFLVTPAYLGATFMEMDQRMEGRVGTLRQLFKYALPIGFKRFYTTFLSMYVVQIVASIVISILLSVVLPLLILSSVASDIGGSEAGLVWMTVLVYLIMALFIITNVVFISLIYPVAAHEGKRAFDAVGRAFKLSFRCFGRQFGACALFVLILLASTVVCILPALLFAGQNPTLAFIANSISVCLWAALIASYYPAFYTALYVDCAARMPDVPDENAAEPPSAPLPQAE